MLMKKMLKRWEGASGKCRRCLSVPCPAAGTHAWGGSLLESHWRDPRSVPLWLQNAIKASGDAGERNEPPGWTYTVTQLDLGVSRLGSSSAQGALNQTLAVSGAGEGG